MFVVTGVCPVCICFSSVHACCSIWSVHRWFWWIDCHKVRSEVSCMSVANTFPHAHIFDSLNGLFIFLPDEGKKLCGDAHSADQIMSDRTLILAFSCLYSWQLCNFFAMTICSCEHFKWNRTKAVTNAFPPLFIGSNETNVRTDKWSQTNKKNHYVRERVP